jgi:type II secretory pathway component PulF
MATVIFAYKALDKSGVRVSGTVPAADRQSAFDVLSARGLSPFELAPRKTQSLRASRRRAITRRDLARYLRQLATLLSANVGVLETLATLEQSAAHPLLAERTAAVKRDLRSGRRFSAAIETHLPELPPYVARLAELGEATGALSKALTDAAERMEQEETMRSEVRSALTYPTFLATVGGAIVLLMFLFVVPRFADLLGENISRAPWYSRVVIEAGAWFRANAASALLAGGFAAVLAGMAMRSDAVRAAVRARFERLPLIGRFLQQAEVGSWARTVGVALSNKAPIIDALRLGEAGARSPSFRRSLELVRRDVRAGRPLDEALLEACDSIDPVVIDLIRTGRSAGALGPMLMFAANLFEKDAKERAKRLTALTEPMAILSISLIVGGIVVAIVTAMTSLYQFDF